MPWLYGLRKPTAKSLFISKINLPWKVANVSGMGVKHCFKKLHIQNQSSGGLKKDVLNFTCCGISLPIDLQFCRKRDSGTVVFLWILRNVFRAPFLQNTSGRLLLSVAIIFQEHSKLNLRKMRATIFWSLTSTF